MTKKKLTEEELLNQLDPMPGATPMPVSDEDALLYRLDPTPTPTTFSQGGQPLNTVTIRPNNPGTPLFEGTPHPKAGIVAPPPLPPISTDPAQPLPSYLQPPAKPDLGLLDIPGAAWKYGVQDLTKLFNAVKNTYQHPFESADALIKGVKNAPKMMRNVLGGAVMSNLTPQVREMIAEDVPALKDSVSVSRSINNAPVAVAGYLDDSYGFPMPNGQKIMNSLGYHPFRSAADASTLLTLPTGLAGVTGAGARMLGKYAGAGMLGEMLDATSTGANAIGRAAELPTRLGDTINPLNFVPDAPGNLIAGAGHVVRGAGAERIGNFLVKGGNIIKPTKMVNNLAGAVAGRAMNPEGRVLLDALGDNATDAQAALEAARNPPPGTSARAGQIVPGVESTGPQALAQVIRSPKFQALGEAAQKNQVDAEVNRLAGNEVARNAFMEREVSGTPTDRAAIEAKQQAMRQRVFGVSDAKNVTVDQDLLDLLNTPEGKAAIDQINTNRANRQLPLLGTGGYMQVGNALGGGTPQLVHLGGDTWIQLGDQLDGLTIHQIKKQLDDAKFRASGAAKPNSDNIRAIDDMSKKFLAWTERPGNIPEYNLALRVDAANNRAMDQINTGVGMQSRVNDPVKFANARDKVGSAKNPSVAGDTGHQFHSRHEDYMLPEHLAAFDTISADHARNALAAEHAGLAGDYRNDINEAFKPVHAYHALGLKGHLAAMLFNNAIKDINPEVAANVSRSLMTPEGTLELLSSSLAKKGKIAKREAQVNALASKFHDTLVRNPTMYNIMEDRRNKLKEAMDQRLKQ